MQGTIRNVLQNIELKPEVEGEEISFLKNPENIDYYRLLEMVTRVFKGDVSAGLLRKQKELETQKSVSQDMKNKLRKETAVIQDFYNNLCAGPLYIRQIIEKTQEIQKDLKNISKMKAESRKNACLKVDKLIDDLGDQGKIANIKQLNKQLSENKTNGFRITISQKLIKKMKDIEKLYKNSMKKY